MRKRVLKRSKKLPMTFCSKGHNELNLLHQQWKERSHPTSGVTLCEDNSHVYVEAALPGINKDQVEITIDGRLLWVHGHADDHPESKKRKYHCRAHKTFAYRLELPVEIEERQEHDAKFDNGLLQLRFEKLVKEPAKRIKLV